MLNTIFQTTIVLVNGITAWFLYSAWTLNIAPKEFAELMYCSWNYETLTTVQKFQCEAKTHWLAIKRQF
jgi:hypothetical protein